MDGSLAGRHIAFEHYPTTARQIRANRVFGSPMAPRQPIVTISADFPMAAPPDAANQLSA
jgi:hypothetical protein